MYLARPPNDKMQLTSGGSMRASHAASAMRRVQLIPVLCMPN